MDRSSGMQMRARWREASRHEKREESTCIVFNRIFVHMLGVSNTHTHDSAIRRTKAEEAFPPRLHCERATQKGKAYMIVSAQGRH